MGNMVKLICERQCGHPDEEIEAEKITPQWYVECPNCYGPRVPREPDESDSEWMERIMQSSVTLHTGTGDEEISMAQLAAFFRWLGDE